MSSDDDDDEGDLFGVSRYKKKVHGDSDSDIEDEVVSSASDSD